MQNYLPILLVSREQIYRHQDFTLIQNWLDVEKGCIIIISYGVMILHCFVSISKEIIQHEYLTKWTRRSTQINAIKSSTCIQLAFRLATHLRWLWSSSNSHASRRKFFALWPPNASQHKFIGRKSCVSAWSLRLFATCVNLQADFCKSVWPPIASPHASSGFANLRRLASTCESVLSGAFMSLANLVNDPV